MQDICALLSQILIKSKKWPMEEIQPRGQVILDSYAKCNIVTAQLLTRRK